MSVNIDDFQLLGDKLFAVSSSTGFSGWYYADIPDSLEPPIWNKIVTPDPSGKLRPIGNMAYQVVDDTDVFWVDAILCNSATVSDVNPFAIYVDPRDGLVKVKEWSNTLPDTAKNVQASVVITAASGASIRIEATSSGPFAEENGNIDVEFVNEGTGGVIATVVDEKLVVNFRGDSTRTAEQVASAISNIVGIVSIVQNAGNFTIAADLGAKSPLSGGFSGQSESMPRAGRCTMWGDFLVLGDIVWKSDPDKTLTQANSSRYRHGLWFSIPGKTDTWDPIDTVFMGQKAGANVVQGMFPLESGLMVITCTLISLLQGSPDDFIYRELREGISNCGRAGNTAWPSKGGVVWNDRNGYVWFSNGEVFQRLDEAVVIDGSASVAAFGEYVFVSTPSDTYVFRLYEEGGGWTRLTGTFGFNKMVATPRFLFGLEAREAVGSFILDSETNGLLDGDDVLWTADRLMTAFDFLDQDRGKFNGRKLRSFIRTRPLPGFGHTVRFWHRYGIRAKGDGRVISGVSRPSAKPEERGLIERVNGDLRRRADYIFNAHGPSFEATFDVEFDGDVTVEHMTVWEHGGRLER